MLRKRIAQRFRGKTKEAQPRLCFFLFALLCSELVQVVLVLELFDTTAAGHILLLACKERMTRRADVQSHFGLIRHRGERVSACASNFTFHIVRMDSFLHASHLSSFGRAKSQLTIITARNPRAL